MPLILMTTEVYNGRLEESAQNFYIGNSGIQKKQMNTLDVSASMRYACIQHDLVEDALRKAIIKGKDEQKQRELQWQQQ
ncbi:hypothetical protein CHS0354_018989 [Potamilus streckersoni]|uniref:Uncharacterized protein n=1 Tax=Potamilus streckersoni TaxID=2493646 RepID=A0AAE0VY57_9BIVA|nr:hypothetical protein CHS0354_018989 [Potamilus streckersoni]